MYYLTDIIYNYYNIHCILNHFTNRQLPNLGDTIRPYLSETVMLLIRFDVNYQWLPYQRVWEASVSCYLPVENDALAPMFQSKDNSLMGEELYACWGHLASSSERVRKTTLTSDSLKELASLVKSLLEGTVDCLQSIYDSNFNAEDALQDALEAGHLILDACFTIK